MAEPVEATVLPPAIETMVNEPVEATVKLPTIVATVTSTSSVTFFGKCINAEAFALNVNR